MSVNVRSRERRRYMLEIEAREMEIATVRRSSSQPSSPKSVQENEKRMRREIANSNERRRMQCINAGFSSLRSLIPQLEGEKLSKAAILQHATEYICSLEKDKTRLQTQLEHTKGLLVGFGQDRLVAEAYVSNSPPPAKRKKRDTVESSDEGIFSLSDGSDDGGSELQQVNVALRHQMELERQRYSTLEEQFRLLESELVALLRVRAGLSANEQIIVKEEHHEQRVEYQRHITECIAADSTVRRLDKLQTSAVVTNQRLSQETLVPDFSAAVVESTNYNLAESVDQHVSVSKSDTNISSSSTTLSVTTTTSAALPSRDQHSFHHHNYCHRDHPRRRHRQQAQLEQQRLEEEQQRRHQHEITSTFTHRPKENTQNLERLVEAIQQIEGQGVLCKIYEDDHGYLSKHGPIEDIKVEINIVSDKDHQIKRDLSARESPLHLHHHNEQNINSKATVFGDNDSSVVLTDRYPIAAHILHHPLHPSFYRPGVIVHKQ